MLQEAKERPLLSADSFLSLATTAQAGLDQRQAGGVSSGLPTWVKGQMLKPSSVAFPDTPAGSLIGYGAARTQLAPIRDAGIAGRGACYSTMPA